MNTTNKNLKLVSIGAGSTYTPDFAEMIIAHQDELPIAEWVLMDIDPYRLEAVGNFVKKILQDAAIDIPIRFTTDLVDAVKDADYVISTIRVGGAHARVLDETIPPKYGMVGQETTAPGGLAMGLRNVPAIVQIARAIETHAKPGAWLINLANPGGMLTEAVYRYSNCKAVGLCNWPSMAWKMTAEAFDVEQKDVFLQFIGLNHLNWAKIFVHGEDVSEEIKNLLPQKLGEQMGMSGATSKFFLPQDLVDAIGWPFAVMYCRYYYLMDEMIEGGDAYDQMNKNMLDMVSQQLPEDVLAEVDLSKLHSRAEFVELIDKITIELYRKLDMSGFRLVQGTRGGAGYGAAGLDVMRAMVNNSNEVQIIDYPNSGSIADIPRECVVQIPCLINGAGVWPLAMGKMERHMHALVNSAKQYEILTIEAAMEGDYRKALEALMASPLENSFKNSRAVLDELLVAHEEYLPNFKEAIRKIKNAERPY